MLHFFKEIDQFGVQQKLQIPPIDPTQKSALGGIATLALYTLSLAYLIYQLIDWQNNNKLPKYTSLKTKIAEDETIRCTDVFAEIQYFQLLPQGYIDPFDPQNLIFQPVLIKIPSDWNQDEIVDLEFQQEDRGDGTYFNKYLIKNITLQGQPEYVTGSTFQKIDYQFQLQNCNQSQLDQSKFVCANQTTIEKFNQQQNFFQIKIYVEQFDTKQKQLTKIPKQYVVDMREGFMQYQQFYLQVNSLTLDDGFLFPNNKKMNFFSNVQIATLQYDKEYSKKYYDKILNSVLYFQIDTLKEESNLEYPKISEILADTGSIITFIMQISFLVSKYNENLCISKTKNEVIKMYYSDYSEYQVSKNWKGEIVQVLKNGETFKHKKILDFFKRLDSVAIQKINYLNLQHEVSKLQILILNLLELDQIKIYLKQPNLRQISQLIQTIKGGVDQPNQSVLNKIFPSTEKLKIINAIEQNEIDTEILQEDVKNSIALLVLDCKQQDEQEELNGTNSKSEIQVINLESNQLK